MVIGFDGSRAFMKERTGTENYSLNLLKALADLHRSNNKNDTVDEYLIYVRSLNGTNEYKWPSNFRFQAINFPWLWTQLGLAKQTFLDKLDILFVPSHTLPVVRRNGLPTIVTVHDLGSEYLPTFHQLKQRLYLNWITHYQLKSATKIIAVSNSTKKDIIKIAKINPGKIDVVYEGVDRSVFNKVKNDMLYNTLRQYELVFNSYFLFIGTIQPRKNLKRLILAYKDFLNELTVNEKSTKSNNIPKLVLAGKKGWLAEEIYSLPAQLGIQSKVEFLGRVADEVLPSLYSGALALVYPSSYEGFGLPVLEAFACGCPVITSNVSSLPEVADKAALLVDPNDTKKIAQTIYRIYNDIELRKDLTKKGFRQVKKFSWKQCALETLNTLKKVNNG